MNSVFRLLEKIPFVLCEVRCILRLMRRFFVLMAYVSSMLFPLPFGWAGGPELEPAPPTKKESVTDTYFDTKVQDDYRWLEQLDDPEVKTWAAAQNARAQSFLAALPGRTQLAAQVKKLVSSAPPAFGQLQLVGGKIFALKFEPAKQQRFIVVLNSPDKELGEKPVCDPNAIDPSGATAIDWFVPSPDGTRVAVCLSRNGTEDGDLYFFDVATTKQLPDVLEHVQFPTGGGSAAWTKDGKGIFYTRYPRTGERPAADAHFFQQVYYHQIGAPESEDVYSVGKEFPKIAEVHLQSNIESDYVVAIVANGDGGDFEHFVYGPDKKWLQITKFEDKVKTGTLAFGPALYAISLEEAPRGKVVKFALDASDIKPAVVVMPTSGVVQEIAVSDNEVLIHTLEGGPSGLYACPLDGSNLKAVPTPPISDVTELAADKDLVLIHIGSYTELPKWFKYEGSGNRLSATALNSEPPVNFADMEVTRDFAVSKDGTKIPLNIVHQKGIALDASHPVILYGYGGYGISETPRVRPPIRAWYDLGGIFVDTNLRGGGEFGEDWHKAGNLTKKQNVFDDFAACAQYLIDHQYTSTSKLGMLGGSNGGLLMGAMITRHPSLMKAVVSQVGIYDSLRGELSPNGLFNTTEFGTVKDPDQFKALYAYSPYQHVVKGTRYPAILLTAGLNDGRVAPYNSFKFAALLQAATAPDSPVLLTVNSFGHGIGSSLDQQVADITDVFSFFAYELGANGK
jgi:prolyl oligopeptidase